MAGTAQAVSTAELLAQEAADVAAAGDDARALQLYQQAAHGHPADTALLCGFGRFQVPLGTWGCPYRPP